ncbi:hypothetical protein TBR22_A42790 [Luteitalea sp. TBR-22]|uniref:DUF1634 domain-containing protein n=1 Tax=Luteitalea sp. TBR-22 TaxID=2802971 RepID=UPI001AF9F3A7|nr:DUF1634 domain-containing protein [Luteitalea sp. TBR-22]BCS35053.1 hypothetical protein TBR22_A42790 [Luteitalea sp. TBR-22]
MAALLRAGVLVAATLALVGGTLTLHAGQFHSPVLDHVFRGQPRALRSVSAVLAGASQGEGPSMMMLGVLVLIATPVVRVAASVALFVAERDPVFIGTTLAVLGVLLVGLIG